MHIDFDEPRTFIPDAVVILIQSTWMFKLDEFVHLLITIGTFAFLLIRIIYFIKDRKEKNKDDKDKSKEDAKDN